MRISDWSSDVCSSDLMEDIRFLVHLAPDAMAAIVAHDRIAAPFRVPLDREADVAEMGAGPHPADALPHRFLRDAPEPHRGGRARAHQIGHARLGDAAVLFARDFECDELAVPYKQKE